jgi:hypothetical protein
MKKFPEIQERLYAVFLPVIGVLMYDIGLGAVAMSM